MLHGLQLSKQRALRWAGPRCLSLLEAQLYPEVHKEGSGGGGQDSGEGPLGFRAAAVQQMEEKSLSDLPQMQPCWWMLPAQLSSLERSLNWKKCNSQHKPSVGTVYKLDGNGEGEIKLRKVMPLDPTQRAPAQGHVAHQSTCPCPARMSWDSFTSSQGERESGKQRRFLLSGAGFVDPNIVINTQLKLRMESKRKTVQCLRGWTKFNPRRRWEIRHSSQ